MRQSALQIRDKLLTGLDSDYNVVNMEVVVDVLSQLEKFQITKEALETTRLGKHINELRRKTQDRHLASRAKTLVKTWRQIVVHASNNNGDAPPQHGVQSKAATNGSIKRKVSPSAMIPPAKKNPPIQSMNNFEGHGVVNKISNGSIQNSVSPPMIPSVTKTPQQFQEQLQQQVHPETIEKLEQHFEHLHDPQNQLDLREQQLQQPQKHQSENNHIVSWPSSASVSPIPSPPSPPSVRSDPVVITEEMVQNLHDSQVESVNGNFDHKGVFKEWHEVVTKETKDGEILYVLPYTIID